MSSATGGTHLTTFNHNPLNTFRTYPPPPTQTSLSLPPLCPQMSFVVYSPFVPDIVDAYLSPLVSEESPVSAAPETPPLDMDLVDFAQFQANPVSAHYEL